MFRLGLLLSLCLYGVVAYRMDYELEALSREWARGVPGTNNNVGGGTSSECKKDIWIVWDNSWSVGESSFQGKIKNFLRELIRSPQLNVGPDGTHLGFLTFSTEIQTKVLLGMGEKESPSELLAWLEQLTWNEVEGDGTRTGMALRKINYELFSKESPKNNRTDVSDVVILFTDGEPIRRKNEQTFGDKYKNRDGESMLAGDMAKEIKEKDITLVGLAVGNERTLRKFRDDMRQWSSEGKYFETSSDSLNTIINQLVSASCIDPGECLCDNIETQAYAAQGGNALIDWIEPTLKCASGREAKLESKVVEPSYSPPHEFGVGHHTVRYTYNYLRGSKIVPQTCFLSVDVNECKCPETVRINADVPYRKDKADVSWTVPKPLNCIAKLEYVTPDDDARSGGRGKYAVGRHEINYHYKHSSSVGTFSLSCPVVITVKAKLCGGVAFGSSHECCCGTVWDRKSQYICCGPKYIDSTKQRCADFYTVVDRS